MGDYVAPIDAQNASNGHKKCDLVHNLQLRVLGYVCS